MNSKDRCMAAIQGQPVDRVPVFPLLMFFAQSRYGISYRQFATDGRVLAEAQLNIRERFPVDALTACSDAFRVAADLGAEMVYPEDRTPYAASPLVRSASDLSRLRRPDPLQEGSRMADRTLGVQCMVEAVGQECLVLGWVDMPFAEACSLCGVSEFMLMLHDDPALAHAILRFLSDIVVDFSLSQLQAGAPMIGAGRRGGFADLPRAVSRVRPALRANGGGCHARRRRPGQAAHLRQHGPPAPGHAPHPGRPVQRRSPGRFSAGLQHLWPGAALLQGQP